LIPDENRSFHN